MTDFDKWKEFFTQMSIPYSVIENYEGPMIQVTPGFTYINGYNDDSLDICFDNKGSFKVMWV